MTNRTTTPYVLAYLGAIVVANLTLAHFGTRAAIYNGFALVAVDLVCRDALHDMWRGRLVRNMLALIATGSFIAWLASLLTTPDELNVARIALASGVAFAVAFTADALVYQRIRDRTWMERSNTSNVAGSFVDSLVFLPLATGLWLWDTMFALACAKIAGGVVWSIVLAKGADGRAWLARNRERYATDAQIDRSFDAYR